MSRSLQRATFLPEVQRPAAPFRKEAASLRDSHLDLYADSRSVRITRYTADLISSFITSRDLILSSEFI